MTRMRPIILWLVTMGGLAGVASLVFIWFSGGSGEATQALTAPTLAPSGDAAAATALAVEGSESRRFEIVPGESEVRFIIHEELRGQPTEVIGRTDQVAGEVFVDFANPAASRVGPVRVNARTLLTDNEFRNRAIRGQILQSSNPEFEFIDFTPTEVVGLPNVVGVGEPVNFQLAGDLRIRDVTQPVTFDVELTPVSEDQLEGLAATTVLREQYGLVIPSVPGVANVTNEVRLELDFVARAAE